MTRTAPAVLAALQARPPREAPSAQGPRGVLGARRRARRRAPRGGGPSARDGGVGVAQRARHRAARGGAGGAALHRPAAALRRASPSCPVLHWPSPFAAAVLRRPCPSLPHPSQFSAAAFCCCRVLQSLRFEPSRLARRHLSPAVTSARRIWLPFAFAAFAALLRCHCRPSPAVPRRRRRPSLFFAAIVRCCQRPLAHL